eukprot:COSAG01_NODE_34766_length_542_cov_1.474041_2_plen_65_part_00
MAAKREAQRAALQARMEKKKTAMRARQKRKLESAGVDAVSVAVGAAAVGSLVSNVPAREAWWRK